MSSSPATSVGQRGAPGRRGPEYDKDLTKHYVRMKGWLQPCLARRKIAKKQNRPVRYFTLCAGEAMDVFMLERTKILRRNRDGILLATWFCEGDQDEFRRVSSRVRTTGRGFPGALEDIVLFKETDETRGRTRLNPGGETGGRISTQLRKALEIKDQHEDLYAAFPFDVVNLDMTTPLFPPRQPNVSRLMQTILQILDWQMTKPLPTLPEGQVIPEFTLMLTVHVDEGPTNQEGVDALAQLVEENIEQVSMFRERWDVEFPDLSPADLATRDFERFLRIALPKLLMERGLSRGWDVTSEGRFLYKRTRRQTTYTMLCEVLTFKGPVSAPVTQLYNLSGGGLLKRAAARITAEVWKAPVWADRMIEVEPMRSEVNQDLDEVNAFAAQQTSGRAY